jgi:predicted Rossmann fold nucleotide-binding protein DprA/Smf involved in DNA uptake
MLRLIIAGSRTFADYELLQHSLDEFIGLHSLGDPHPGVVIISGMAKGADLLGLRYAAERGYTVEEFPADWSKGRSAGPQRNRDMANSANACIVFWDGKSKGTASMIALAKRQQLQLQVIHYGSED